MKNNNVSFQSAKPLVLADMMEVAKAPWEAAFSSTINLSGWRETGLYPYTRKVYHMLLGAEEAKRATAANFRDLKR